MTSSNDAASGELGRLDAVSDEQLLGRVCDLLEVLASFDYEHLSSVQSARIGFAVLEVTAGGAAPLPAAAGGASLSELLEEFGSVGAEEALSEVVESLVTLTSRAGNLAESLRYSRALDHVMIVVEGRAGAPTEPEPARG